MNASRGVLALMAAAGLATVGLLLFADGNLLLALLPAGAVVGVALIRRVPTRTLLFLLVFLAIGTESPGDASGLWKSPLYTLGVLLHSNLNLVLPVQALKFTGLDVLIVALFVLAGVRRARRDPLESGTRVPCPIVLRGGAMLTLATLLMLVVMGAATGGDLHQVYWQIHQFALVPILFLLADAVLRGPDDLPALGRVYIAAALLKALVAVGVAHSVTQSNGLPLPTATSHGDSVLFAGACAILLAGLVERPTRKQLLRTAVPVLILFGGMIANNRRLVWVELAGVLACFFLLSPVTRLKRKLAKVAVLGLPLYVLYIAIGWNSTSKIFKPVQTIKSLAVSKTDRSTEERDVENYNLMATMRQNPVFGTGYGHEYIEAVKGDDISDIFPQYRYIPHNSLLGVWAFAGALGFTGLWLLVALAVFFAARAYRAARVPWQRAGAMVVVGMVLVYMIQCYGDMGFVSWTGSFTLALGIGVAGKLAVGTGAWPARRPVTRSVRHTQAMAAEAA